jgi:phage antirepressor YoqD-like protein
MNELELVTGAMSKSMTVRQTADALGVDCRTINRHVARLYPGKAINGIASMLDESQVTEIKKAIERSGRNDLDNVVQVQGATTELEMRQKAAEVMAWLLRDNESLKAKNAELEPKAAFFDQVADSKTALQMRDVAAALNLPGWGRNKIFQFLRDQSILDERNIPYREYQDRGYFRVIEQTWTDPEGETHVSLKTLVYQKGVDFIRKTIERAK